jgi:hypothetical protein
MKKLKHEKELTKKALEIGEKYAKNRGFSGFSATMSANQKIESLYRLLVQDTLIQPLPEQQETVMNMKHKLAVWISHQLPDNHPLLN